MVVRAERDGLTWPAGVAFVLFENISLITKLQGGYSAFNTVDIITDFTLSKNEHESYTVLQ